MELFTREDEWFALRQCSMAARGLWADISYLANRVGNDLTAIRRLACVAEKEFAELTAELERAGVMKLTAAGEIYSYRLARETHRRMLAKENGRKGGRPSLAAELELARLSGGLTTQKAETR